MNFYSICPLILHANLTSSSCPQWYGYCPDYDTRQHSIHNSLLHLSITIRALAAEISAMHSKCLLNWSSLLHEYHISHSWCYHKPSPHHTLFTSIITINIFNNDNCSICAVLCNTCLQNDLLRAKWDVKPTHSITVVHQQTRQTICYLIVDLVEYRRHQVLSTCKSRC